MSTNRFLVVPFLVVGAALGSGCGLKGPLPDKPQALVGHCIYVNRFSQREECREYRGTQWTETEATQDCKGVGSQAILGSACSYESILGECVTGAPDKYSWLYFPGDDPAVCNATKRGCEFFGGGIFGPSSVCGGVDDSIGGTGLPVFQWPELVCRAPVSGEPAGRGANGAVCTWEMISGATEEGRRFTDYASCDRVRTQRPYYPVPTNANAEREDARLSDPTYTAELSWVKAQVQATACVCCHSTAAPKGTSNWYVDQPGNFLNGFFNRGLAMGAGWIDTTSFGAYRPEQNNGFHRASQENPRESIFVTTDPARMKRFFEAELASRGLTKDDFAGQTYGAGPLDDQRFFRPSACVAGEGVAADGTVTWTQGPARYVYVLEADAASPGVPPNFDMPSGTRWRVQVPWTGQAVASGALKYGVVPDGFEQRMPESGPPQPLVSGRQYYLYVLADIAIPNARCLFTAP